MRLAVAGPVLGLALALGAGGAAAADLNNQALTFSPGSCEQYLNARFEKKTVFFKGWLSGWISAHNRLMPDTYSLIPSGDDEQLEKQLQALEDWCQLHPLEDFVAAAGALVDELSPKRIREAPQ
jgi:hypothetical protein